MSKLKWDQVGERLWETGLDRGVLFPMTAEGVYGTGVAWNGLTAVNEAPTGAEANAKYADNQKYANLISNEDFKATIEAFTYPPEFEDCDGSAELAPGITIGQQNRKVFGFSYRTLIGNDVTGQDLGYKIHLVYGALAAPSSKDRTTTNESPDIINFSWEVSTTPVEVPGFKPTAHLVIDSTKTKADVLSAIENMIYGTDGDNAKEPHLPLPSEIIELLKELQPAG